MEIHVNGIYELRDAIIEQAAKDYLKYKTKLEKMNPDDKNYAVVKMEYENVKKFFTSTQIEALGISEGKYLLEQLDKASRKDAKRIMIGNYRVNNEDCN